MRIVNEDTLKKAADVLSKKGTELFFIHADILKGFNIKLENFSSAGIMSSHIECIRNFTHHADLWFPAFNYDFPKTRIHDVNHSPSQVGHLTEYFRTSAAEWRTKTPMFSISGTGSYTDPELAQDAVIDPWDENSFFAALIRRKGSLLFYGAGFESITLIHYIERNCKELLYRYTKLFAGKLIDAKENEISVSLRHHVRPMGISIHYDWEKLMKDIQDAGLLTDLSDKRTRILLIPAAELSEFWIQKMNEDPLYFLDKKTLDQVVPKLEELGRGFTINDFEK